MRLLWTKGVPHDLPTALDKVENWLRERDEASFPILLHPEYAEERTFSVSSPYRRVPIEERSNPYFKTKKTSLFAGGHHNKDEEKLEKKKHLRETVEVSSKQEEEFKDDEGQDEPQLLLHDMSPNIEALGRHIRRNSERNHLESIVNAEKMLYADSSPESDQGDKDDQLSLTLKDAFTPPDSDSDIEPKKEDDQRSQISLPPSTNHLGFQGISLKNRNLEAIKAESKFARNKPGLLELKKITVSGETENSVEEQQTTMQDQTDVLKKRLEELKAEKETGELVHFNSGIVQQTTAKVELPDVRRKSENVSNLFIRRNSNSPDRIPSTMPSLDTKVFNVSEIQSQVGSQTESIPSTRQPNGSGKCASPDPAKSYTYFLATRPLTWEMALLKAARKALKKKERVKVIVMNISHSETIFSLKGENRASKLNLYADTSIPFLYFHDKRIVKRVTAFKGSPPIRDKTNRIALIHEILLGCLDSVSSYHCTVPDSLKFLKERNFSKAINGYQTAGHTLQGLWTVVAVYKYLKDGRKKGDNLSCKDLVRQGFPTERENYEKLLSSIVKVLSLKPAEMIGLGTRKGQIKKGFDADIVVMDPFSWSKTSICSKHPKSALFQDENLLGIVQDVYLRGRKIVSDSKCLPLKSGVVLKRSFKNPPQFA
eukprot:TRINITY_DN2743_c0_g1_i1.p1 TRINITY_DN2743_c0_g1~~TRINITY_DN2743_c0_g1_i1.p1  ORF type:complete len:655 (-),score=112.76 TRINITY_DN2743_c0_g1_i1:99-2063(-)